MSESTILSVDDDETITKIVEKTLTDHGYNVLSAANGEAALEILETEDITGIVLDIKMPGMDGNEVLGKIRANEKTKDIPVLMLTGENSINDVSRSLEIGANDYMVKPFEPQLIVTRLKGILS